MTEKENFVQNYRVCELIDPIMIIHACMTNLKQNSNLDDNSKLCFKKMNNSINSIYRFILEDKEVT